jgi:Asp/Glu/hydantoin racemase
MSHNRIVLIHATRVAMDPIAAAFALGWSQAETINLLDDSLSIDRARQETLSPALAKRIMRLADYAESLGADGILYTCSAFGDAIETAARLSVIPVLKPNEAMFEAAIGIGGRIAMIATFAPAIAGMELEFRKEAARLGSQATLESFLAEGAIEALRDGDAWTHNCLVAEQAAKLYGFDGILLAHFSTARAAEAVRKRVGVPVLTSPDAAVEKIRRLVTRV